MVRALGADYFGAQDPGEINLMDRLKPPGYVDDRAGCITRDRPARTRSAQSLGVWLACLAPGWIHAVLIGGALGLMLGLLSGYYGSWLDDVIMRLAERPTCLSKYLALHRRPRGDRTGLINVIAILGFTGWVVYGRVARGQVLSVREQEFVIASRSIGCRDARILWRHVLPNIFGALIVVGSFAVASNIIARHRSAFSGWECRRPFPTGGSCFPKGKSICAMPGGGHLPRPCDSVDVLSINSLGDWLRDYLDPRIKTQE